jgi:fumarylacetoacetase
VSDGSWLTLPADTGFGPANLPFGVFSWDSSAALRVGVAIGGQVLDLTSLAAEQNLRVADLFAAGTLDRFLAAGRPVWREIRARLTDWLTSPTGRPVIEPHLLPRNDVRLHLPFTVGDYVDFYSSRHHAENAGRIFRPNLPPLPKNWLHLPVGYHGRSGTVVVSGTDIVRPRGQRLAPGEQTPSYGPTLRLDMEVEVGFVVGTPSRHGIPVPLADFAEHVFGVFLVNDWSARDIQMWESQPLGPFLGKSFATSISPWVVPLDALEQARVAPPPHDPEPMPYLAESDEPWGLDLALEARLNGHPVSRPPFASMYWTPAQQLAQLTANGASVRTGDFYASGTVSGPEPDQRGSFLELSWGGRDPLTLPDGSQRTFLADDDEVTITASAPGPDGGRIDFGEVTGRIRPALGTSPG